MSVPLNLLKIAIFISGFFILIYSIYFLGLSSWITYFLLDYSGGYLDGIFGLLIIFLWGICAMIWSMVYCAIKGAKNENKQLLQKLIFGCIFHLIINIVIFTITTELLVISIISIINIIIFVLIIIILSCFISHSKNKEKNEKFRSLIYDQDAYNQYLAQQKV